MQPKAPDQTKQATLPRNETKTNNAVQMHIFPTQNPIPKPYFTQRIGPYR
jgi:hypothetical protein